MQKRCAHDGSLPGNRASSETLQEQVYAFTRQIQPGQVVSYGTVAANCPPLTPRQVGQLMALAPDDVPWWRVVGADGTLRIRRRDPLLAQIQQKLLEAEGVLFDESGRVAKHAMRTGEQPTTPNRKAP